MNKQSLLVRTDDVNWELSQEALDTYIQGNYAELANEDRFLGATAISVIAAYARHHDLFHSFSFGASICTGGVPRGSAIIAPLIKSPEEGGYIEVSDREERATDVSRKTMHALAHGKLDLWETHQKEYTATNPLWQDSFQLAGKLAQEHILAKDMRDLSPNTYPVISAEYGPESATSVEEEYLSFIQTICDALIPGGILYMPYLIESDGYTVGGVDKPSYPVTVDYVTKALEKNDMRILINAGTTASYTVREPGDTRTYTGMGVAVAVRQGIMPSQLLRQ